MKVQGWIQRYSEGSGVDPEEEGRFKGGSRGRAKVQGWIQR